MTLNKGIEWMPSAFYDYILFGFYFGVLCRDSGLLKFKIMAMAPSMRFHVFRYFFYVFRSFSHTPAEIQSQTLGPRDTQINK